MPNRLAHENSPYLVQHANNPVNWYPWGEEALSRARAENKPIFLSIGYAACHWCHVMARESFEDQATASILNEHFINIKVDREERPDLDNIYMSATVALTGSGGWPMSVFLTPELHPFYAGTYFPPVARYNMPSFRDLLEGIINVWQNEAEKARNVGMRVTDHIQQAITQNWRESLTLTGDLLDNAADHLHASYDWGFGGWGGAPKFPQPMTIEFLLSRATYPAPHEKRQLYIKTAIHALHAMARGGMYDVVGGGFARYSVDNLWRVPHFEKMLYDNAQLARAYLHAWKLTGEPSFRQVATETLDFVLREMTHPEGGFYSSLDADSEHEEGKFYVWRYDEIEQALGEDFGFFKIAYGLTPQGNWEGKIVLQRAVDDATLAARTQTPRSLVPDKLSDCHARLLAIRNKRVRPGTDDKILTSWNAMMLQTLAEAAASDEALYARYHDAVLRNVEFLLQKLRPAGKLKHSWRNNSVKDEVFLEDYAAAINALLAVYQMDFDNTFFVTAMQLADEMHDKFNDPSGGFFDTPSDSTGLLIRPKDVQDNATPSGNALACLALLKLSAYTDRADFRAKAEQMLGKIAENAIRYPTAFAQWLQAADFAVGNVKQVAVVGDPHQAETKALLAELQKGFVPRMVKACSALPLPLDAPILLKDRPMVNGKPTAYVCENFTCQIPVNSPERLQKQLEIG